MADEKYTFEQARIRLEEIATEVRKKDTSLEKSLDLLEEGVRLANICTELVDHTDVGASVVAAVENEDAGADNGASEQGQVPEADEAGVDAPGNGSDAGSSEAGEADSRSIDGGEDVADGAGGPADGIREPAESNDDGTEATAEGFDDADDEVGEPSDTGIED